MKCAVVSALISLAFVSQAFAVLRPLFPVKPEPPFSGEVIIIGGDSVTAIQIVRPLESIAETQPQFYLGLRRFSMMIFHVSPPTSADASFLVLMMVIILYQAPLRH